MTITPSLHRITNPSLSRLTEKKPHNSMEALTSAQSKIRSYLIPLLSWVAVYILYFISLFISNLINEGDKNNDLHGFINIIFGGMVTPILTITAAYLGGNKSVNELMVNPLDRQMNSNTFTQPTGWGIGHLAVIIVLIILWTATPFYCQLLYSGASEALTDKSVIEIELSPIAAEKFLITFRGILYLGTFFPIVAGSAFLCGWAAKRLIPCWLMLIPASVMYSTMNFIAIQRTGYPSAFQGIKAMASKLPNSLGDITVVWFYAVAIFITIVLALALYGWIFSIMGLLIRKLLVRVK